jgi:hypothetical protein
METTLPQPYTKANGRRLADKECINSLFAVVSTTTTPMCAVTVRWYMGRSRSASVVYCSIYVNMHDQPTEVHCSGYGKASGSGYDKRSAAFQEAVDSAGITLPKRVSGRGHTAVESAVRSIAAAAGWDPAKVALFW